MLGPSLTNAMIADRRHLVLPHFVRLTRASVISESAPSDYVTARPGSTGARLPRLMFITVLPNCMAPLIVQASAQLSPTAILDAAALGFLGLRAPSHQTLGVGRHAGRRAGIHHCAPGGW